MLWSVALILVVQICCVRIGGIEVDGGVSDEIIVQNEVDTAEDVPEIEVETYDTETVVKNNKFDEDVDVELAFEKSFKDLANAEKHVQEVTEIVDDINDDINKAKTMHTKVKH